MNSYHGSLVLKFDDPETGNAGSNQAISVFLTGTTTLATLYELDGATVKGNPFLTDNYGNYSFKVDGGTYDIVSASGVSEVGVQIQQADIIGDLSQAYEFTTLDDAVNSTIQFPVGKVINLKERTLGNGGGAAWGVVLASSVTPNGHDIVACTGVSTLALKLITGDTIIASQWGVIASSTPLSSDEAIQAAFDAAQNKQIILPVNPPCWTSTPIKLKTGTKILKGNIKANNLQNYDMSNFQQPSDPESYGQISVDKPPILYNPNPIQWWEIHNLWLDGNSEDVYSHILYGAYYGLQEKVVAYRCLAGAFTEIRTQVVHHDQCVAYQCGGTIMFNWTNLTFTCCGFERTKNSTVAVDLRQPVGFNKGGVAFDDCWFEDEIENGGGVDGTPPSAGYLRVAGRNCRGSGLTFATAGPLPIRAIWGMPENNATTVFGIDMTSAPCLGGEFDINITSSNLFPEFSIGSNNNLIKGFWTAADGIDSGLGNQWDNQGTALYFAKATERFQVRRNHTSVSANDYVVDIDYNSGSEIIRLFGNSNNAIKNNSGIMEINSNSIMRLNSGNSVAITPSSGKKAQFAFSSGGTLSAIGLPTTSAGLVSGDVWNDVGTLKIV